jgi:hypothetical protein
LAGYRVSRGDVWIFFQCVNCGLHHALVQTPCGEEGLLASKGTFSSSTSRLAHVLIAWLVRSGSARILADTPKLAKTRHRVILVVRMFYPY